MLNLSHINVYRGAAQIIFDVDLNIQGKGEVVGLLGRNGMGKTTIASSIMGIFPLQSGTISFCGKDITGLSVFQIALSGLGLVPEERSIFASLTVEENLRVGMRNSSAFSRPISWSLSRVYEMQPLLKEKRRLVASVLSGGEQQLLAIYRALMTNPRFLILDDITEGLAPLMRRKIWDCVSCLKGEGVSMLVIDKDIHELCAVADRHYIIERGTIVWHGATEELRREEEVRRHYLGI